ncbi:MAG: universal stress protein, partial [Bacteroidota bacterium]
MYNFKRWMVGLDFTVMDQTLIEYTAFLAHFIRPDKIYFVNVQEDLDVPDDLRREFEALETPRDELLCKEMEEEVLKYFPSYKDYDGEFQVIEGSPMKEMLRWTHIKNIDLLITGRKKVMNGSGVVPQQLARKISCSILFVPEEVEYSLNNLLVPTDFSDQSMMALEVAASIARRNDQANLYSLHCYTVPKGYYRTGKTEEQFAAIMLKHAKNNCSRFLKKFSNEGEESVEVEPLFVYDEQRHHAGQLINEQAKAVNADMVVIGARGRTDFAAIFLGSTAEKLLLTNS